MARIQCHIIRAAEANGVTSSCMVTVKHPVQYMLVADKTVSDTEIVVRDRDQAETQRPLGPVHTRKEAE
jgi:hypothetical protein